MIKHRENPRDTISPTDSQICESCGANFVCEVNLENCWCSRVQIGAECGEFLRRTYQLCLCRACLQQHENRFSPAANAAE